MSDEPNTKDASPNPADASGQVIPEPAADFSAADQEVEYVYQDEHGNPIAAPEGGFADDEYEEVVVEEETEPASAPAEPEESAPPEAAVEPAVEASPAPVTDQEPAVPSPETASAATAPTVTMATQPTRKYSRPGGSSRRTTDGKSGRQPKQAKPMTPEELKKVRRKVILLLTLLGLIPVLSIALLIVLYKKGRLPLVNKPHKVYVDNAYDRSVKIVQVTDERYNRADKLFHDNKRAEAKREYQECLREFNDALGSLEKFIDEHKGEEYSQVELLARQIRMKRTQVQARLVMLEND